MDAEKPPRTSADLPSSLEAQLARFRTRLWLHKASLGVLILSSVLLLGLVIVYISDRFSDTPVSIRALVLAVSLAGAAFALGHTLVKWIWGHRSQARLSKVVAGKFPNLGDRLLGAIELSEESTEATTSKTLREAALNQVARDAEKVPFHQALSMGPVRVALFILIALLSLVVLIGWLAPDSLRSAWKRWALPQQPTPRYTFTQLESLSETQIVPAGESLEWSARLTDNSPWKPEKGRLRLGDFQQSSLLTDKQSFDFKLPPQSAPRELVLSAGDFKETVNLVPTERPRLIRLTGKLTYPSYLGYADKVMDLLQPEGLLAGSELTIAGETDRPISRVTLNWGTRAPEPSIREASFSFPPLPVTGSQEPPALAWTDHHGLTGSRPHPIRFSLLKDGAPVIRSPGLPRNLILLPDETLTLPLLATDDYGLQEIGIAWKPGTASDASETPLSTQRVWSGKHDTLRANFDTVFSPATHQLGPGMVQLSFYALDFNPEAAPSYSAIHQLQILDFAQHAQQIHLRFGEISDRLETVVREEETLLAGSEALMKAPEMTEQALKLQAKKEDANARKFEALHAQAASLFAEALRNKTVNEKALSEWTNMLGMLKEAAEQTLPKVASLIETASQAGTPGLKMEMMEEAVAVQKAGLKELSKSLDSAHLTQELLEGSSFVNRLRKASREENLLAEGFQKWIGRTIGMTRDELNPDDQTKLGRFVQQQDTTTKEVGFIKDDLKHYFNRTRKEKYDRLHQEMVESRVVESLQHLQERVARNQAFVSINEARRWSAQLETWADQLNPKQENTSQGEGGEDDQGGANREFMLRILRLVQDEMDIRNTTRVLEQGKDRDSLYLEKARQLAKRQKEGVTETRKLLEEFPFPGIAEVLLRTQMLMGEVADRLARPDTGGETIAAETEIIEMLAAASESSSAGGGAEASMEEMMQMLGQMQIGQTAGGNSQGGDSRKANESVEGHAEGARSRERETDRVTGVQSDDDLPSDFREVLELYFEVMGTLR
ncbi:MAG: hypothetical protein AAF514_11900 [Verrucomicrobiota bacterium]